MAKSSIRQFAEDLGVSHNTVRNTIKDLELQLGIVIGESQGKGKPTFLSDDDQALIRERLNRSITSNEQISIIPYVPTRIEKSSLDSVLVPMSFQTLDTDTYTNQLSTKFESDLDVVQKNTDALDSALILKLKSEGKLLGHQLFEAKYGTAFNTLNNLEQMAAKKQGLTA